MFQQETSAADCEAKGHVFQTLLKLGPKVKLCRLLGKVTPSKLWLKSRQKSSSSDC